MNEAFGKLLGFIFDHGLLSIVVITLLLTGLVCLIVVLLGFEYLFYVIIGCMGFSVLRLIFIIIKH